MGETISNTDIYVEQVWAKMPEIVFCIGGDDNRELDVEQLEVYRGSEPLAVTSLQELSEIGADSELYVLLDVSLSISQTDFEAVRQELCRLYENRAPGEKVILVTFGDEVELVLNGTEQTEDALTQIGSIVRDAQNTNLFEGIRRVTDMIERREEADFIHTGVVVITDGMDTAVGSATLQEAQSGLERQGVPLYGIASASGERESINRLGEFVRATGGRLETWDADGIGNAMKRFLDAFHDVKVLRAEASSNLVSYQAEQMTIRFEQWNFSKNIDIYTEEWIPDMTAPVIEEVMQSGSSQLLVVFSEPVSGMDNPTNYQLAGNEERYAPLSVQKKDDVQVLLSFPSEFESGSYELSCVNMTDISMEANPLTESFEILLAGIEAESGGITNESAEETEAGTGAGFRMGIGAVLLGAALLLCVLFVAMYRNKRKRMLENESGSVISAWQLSSKKHIAVVPAKGIALTLYPRNCGNVQGIQHTMCGSLIVGRSDICEIYFDDALMSRQHFALEYDKGNMLIQDLDTVNGTFVNGVRIHGKHVLKRKDVIGAGSLELMVDWEEEGA